MLDASCLWPSILFFFFNDTATPEIYPLSLHDALPICALVYDRATGRRHAVPAVPVHAKDPTGAGDAFCGGFLAGGGGGAGGVGGGAFGGPSAAVGPATVFPGGRGPGAGARRPPPAPLGSGERAVGSANATAED